jgi:hypothetical protein
MFKAILSTTVLPLDGVYRVETLALFNEKMLDGVPHYVGHPDTKEQLEFYGAVKAPSNLFGGLQVGESCLCVPLAKPRDNGNSNMNVEKTLSSYKDLSFRVLTRLE